MKFSKDAYDEVIELNSFLYKVKKNGFWGIVNFNEEIVLDIVTKECFSLSKNGTIIYQDINLKYWLFNVVTKEINLLNIGIIPFEYSSYNIEYREYHTVLNHKKRGISCKTILTSYSGYWGIIDNAGNQILPNIYSFVRCCARKGYYIVALGTLTMYKRKGKSDCIKGLKWGVVDGNNKIIVPISYDWIDELTYDLWTVGLGGEIVFTDYEDEFPWTYVGSRGVVNSKHKLLIPQNYNHIFWHYDSDCIEASKGEQWFFFKLNGEEITKSLFVKKEYFKFDGSEIISDNILDLYKYSVKKTYYGGVLKKVLDVSEFPATLEYFITDEDKELIIESLLAWSGTSVKIIKVYFDCQIKDGVKFWDFELYKISNNTKELIIAGHSRFTNKV